ncbi:hypothetical protein R5R35_004465 [Gryllus longicercus]|uniref:RING-type E3 ubiquitin transferase n=1 Tax=Gryllus longicercus TaxID=2509291 RepID=A0AAN9VDG4_9ORTH
MWCLVSQPNSVILEVEVDPKAKGQECLEKVCQCLGISNESDYFGLKYHCAKGEELWLNLRNPIERQVAGMPPYRFALRVKFWVPPHLLLQDSTRHQFYLNARLDLAEGRLRVTDAEAAAKLVALLVQAEFGDHEQLACANSAYVQASQLLAASTATAAAAGAPPPPSPAPAPAPAPSRSPSPSPSPPTQAAPEETPTPTPRAPDFLRGVAARHRELQGMKPSAAEYWLLKEVSYLDNFGEEMFYSKTCSGGMAVGLGVGPHGITIYQSDSSEKQSIPYTAIQSAASQRRSFHLTYLSLDGDETLLDVKLESSQVASGLYRAITEKHAFYSCETVRSAVTAQFIRDLKGTIVSIFNEDTSLGKKYVFDIQRTCREVYDNARRALYQSGSSLFPPPEESMDDECTKSPEKCKDCSGQQCKSSQKQLVRLLEAMACRICMDRAIDTAFFPCAHVMACGECAARCERCPLCRAQIEQSRRIYLPLELQQQQLPEVVEVQAGKPS